MCVTSFKAPMLKSLRDRMLDSLRAWLRHRVAPAKTTKALQEQRFGLSQDRTPLDMTSAPRLTCASRPAAGGRAIYASGSPQEDVVMDGRKIASSQVRAC